MPGSDVFDTRPVPRGAVAEVTYYSDSLGMFRRMHVYTPPGYETSGRKYPVLYLLHGAGDSDHSWSTAGRAGFILDNLIAKKSAKDMIVVMPAGHTRTPAGAGVVSADANAAFSGDFLGSVVPYVEQHYRVAAAARTRRIAGLSMGGGQTLDIATAHAAKFGYVGVFSSGLFGVFAIPGRGAAPPAWSKGSSDWEKRNAAALADDKTKKGLKLFWFSTGKRRLPGADHALDGQSVQGVRLRARLQGERGRPHLDQLARLPERVRAASLPLDDRGSGGRL